MTGAQRGFDGSDTTGIWLQYRFVNLMRRYAMDGNDMIGLLPFWLLVAPPVLAILSTLVDGTWQRSRDTGPNRY